MKNVKTGKIVPIKNGLMRIVAGFLALFLMWVLSFFVVTDILNAAGGDLDLSFGTGGKVITDFSADDDKGQAIAVQSDGKIIVAGITSVGSNFDFALARYNTD